MIEAINAPKDDSFNSFANGMVFDIPGLTKIIKEQNIYIYLGGGFKDLLCSAL